MENIPISADKIVVSNEMPSGIERRLVLQLLGYWRSICHEGRLPAFTNVDLSEVPQIKPHSFSLDLVGGAPTPVFTAAGSQFAMHAQNTLIGLSTIDLPAETLPGAATAYIDEVLTKGAPVSRGGELVDKIGVKLLYRSILLPMSDDGETVSGILGAANSRIVQGEEVTDDMSEENQPVRAFEIHTFREGAWKVDSIFDDRELAIFEAKKSTRELAMQALKS